MHRLYPHSYWVYLQSALIVNYYAKYGDVHDAKRIKSNCL
jgi:hypothetical protein